MPQLLALFAQNIRKWFKSSSNSTRFIAKILIEKLILQLLVVKFNSIKKNLLIEDFVEEVIQLIISKNFTLLPLKNITKMTYTI